MSEKEIPRIGEELSEGEKLYFKFMDTFQDAVEDCVKTGRESRMVVAMGERSVLVQISEVGKESSFDNLAEELAKGNFEVRDHKGNVINVKPTELEPT